jgi:hypothetical protein
MTLDLSSLLAPASLRKPRWPVAEEMLSIRVRDIRPLVVVRKQTVRLTRMGDSLSLLCRWRSGGCFGPEAAAAMNARQRHPRGEWPAAEPQLVRGATGGWHLDLPGLLQAVPNPVFPRGLYSKSALVSPALGPQGHSQYRETTPKDPLNSQGAPARLP